MYWVFVINYSYYLSEKENDHKDILLKPLQFNFTLHL